MVALYASRLLALVSFREMPPAEGTALMTGPAAPPAPGRVSVLPTRPGCGWRSSISPRVFRSMAIPARWLAPRSSRVF